MSERHETRSRPGVEEAGRNRPEHPSLAK